MKNLTTILLLIAVNCFSQVGINTTTPNAQLEIKATNQATPSNTDGLLIPKIDAFPVTNPTALQNGMMVYLTTVSGLNLPGFYYWNDITTSWKMVADSPNSWSINGNSGTTATSNFIGTADDNDVVFKRDNIFHGHLGFLNVSFGNNSLKNTTTGNYNVAIGPFSMGYSNGSGNTAVGSSTLFGNSTGSGNTALGSETMPYNQTGNNNTAVGSAALYANFDGDSNTTIGVRANASNVSGSNNTALGTYAMGGLAVSGSENIAIGKFSLAKSSGNLNIIIGNSSLENNISGNSSLVIGHNSLSLMPNYSSNNIVIGNNIELQNSFTGNELCIGKIFFGKEINSTATAKISIGEPNPAAKFQIKSSNQAVPENTDGIIIPKIDAFPLWDPYSSMQGMMVYLTTTSGSNLPGFYYWDDTVTQWKPIANPTDAKPFNATGSSTGIYNISLEQYTIRVFNGISNIKLPNAVGNTGKVYIIIGSNGIATKTFSTAGGTIYDDVTNTTITTLSANQRFMVQSDGTDWIVISN